MGRWASNMCTTSVNAESISISSNHSMCQFVHSFEAVQISISTCQHECHVSSGEAQRKVPKAALPLVSLHKAACVQLRRTCFTIRCLSKLETVYSSMNLLPRPIAEACKPVCSCNEKHARRTVACLKTNGTITQCMCGLSSA